MTKPSFIRNARWSVYLLSFFTVLLQQAFANEVDPGAPLVRFKLAANALIVLPVKVNGAGPFDFVLDTGTSETVVDNALATQLRLPVTGTATTILVLAKPSVSRMARAERLEVEGEEVKDLDLTVLSLEALKAGYPKARGILGEDFLRNFDLLLDNHRHLLRMERGPNPMAEALGGEHVPLSNQGSYLGKTTHNRLMLTLKIPEVTALPLTLQLDSAAGLLILFKRSLLSLSEDGWQPVIAGNDRTGRTAMYQRRVKALAVGNHVLHEITAMSPAVSEDKDSDGLLPTNLFQSVYISHSGGFVIFNPTKRTMLARELP
jgi:Aspartyl protease